ncbi:hypothetical protein FQR65_LT05316 [Abscondita terminalis]|nr:hypothetical protein FQR65_LT05316 [Abscondita terminalis]
MATDENSSSTTVILLEIRRVPCAKTTRKLYSKLKTEAVIYIYRNSSSQTKTNFFMDNCRYLENNELLNFLQIHLQQL